MIGVISGLLIACALLMLAPPALASSKHAALIIDANTGRTLYARESEAARYPASLTKMMTLYLVFELMQEGRLHPSTPIRFSERAADAAPSRLGLAPGTEITLIDAIKAVVTKSANDVAVAIAEKIGGTEENFARLMTRKAHALGMKGTTFKNAHGLPNSEQVTTARDMAALALHLIDDFPRYYRLFATRSFSINGRTYRNHNTLLGRYEGTDGIKTGYTSASGFNLVASVRRDGKHVIGVVFGGRSAAARNAQMRTLLTRALRRASTHKTRRPVRVASTTAKRPVVPRPVRAAVRAEKPARSIDDLMRELARTEDTRTEASTPQAAAPTLVRGPRIEIARVRRVTVAPWAGTAREARAPILASAATQDSAETDGGGGSGAAPSSLQAQIERLSRGEPAVAAPGWQAGSRSNEGADARPARTAVAAPETTGAFVQVGAFRSQSEAQRRLETAREQSGGLLDGRQPVMQPVESAGRQLYRARFAGFDPQAATATCQALKRRNIDCLVVR